MSSIIKIVCISFLIFTLVGCKTTEVISLEKTPLNLSVPKHLELEPIEWNVRIIDNDPYFMLNSENYESLARNTEQIQNRLYLFHQYIKEYKEYYE